MVFLLFFALAVTLWLSISFRVAFFHPIKTVRFLIADLFMYFKHKRWNECREGGKLICFVGLFGKGKTLSAVHYVRSIYNKYDGLQVFDQVRNKWVTQRVKVISNVDLTDIPYEKFVSLSQLVRHADNIRDIDNTNDTATVCIALGDEFSVQLNSREFRNSIDAFFLNTLLTCRHHGAGMSLVYTTQRFSHVDALLRQVTSVVIQCDKKWRFMVHDEFDAFELENATSTAMIHSQARYGWFVTNADYHAYDTKQCVGNLAKSCKEGDMLSEEEILALQCNQPAQMEVVNAPSRRYFRNQRRRH